MSLRKKAPQTHSHLVKLYSALEKHHEQLQKLSDVESLHDYRGVLLRLRFFLKQCPPKKSKPIDREIKPVVKLCGNMRNFDVLLNQIESHLNKGRMTNPQKHALENAISVKRRKLERALRRAMMLPVFQKSLKEAGQLIEETDILNRELFYQPLQQLKKWQSKKIKKSNIHKLRRIFKRLRYASEVDTSNARWLEISRTYQDLLGKYQDAITTLDLLEQFPSSMMVDPFIAYERKRADKYYASFNRKWPQLRKHI